MAVKEFNCNKLKRTFWPFTMKDKTDENGKVLEKGRKIIVRMPQKQVFEAINGVQGTDGENPALEDTEAVYGLLAAVLSNNVGRVKVTKKDLEDYDIEECAAILEAYMDFVGELKMDPN